MRVQHKKNSSIKKNCLQICFESVISILVVLRELHRGVDKKREEVGEKKNRNEIMYCFSGKM